MKNKIVYCFLCLALLLTSCKDHSSLTDKELHQQLITSATWTLDKISVDNVNQSTLFAGMTLSFTESNYTATLGQPVWPANGTWAFSDDSGKNILRDGNVEVILTEISESKLVLSLQWDKTTYAGGRQGSIKGNHVFTFKK